MSERHIESSNEPRSDVSTDGWRSMDSAASINEPPMATPPPRRPDLDWHAFIECLPRLGPQLWLHEPSSDCAFPRARLLPQGVLLLDHPALAAFADSTRVDAHCAVTAHGPREWLEFHNELDRCIARLYLLPDTDCLAWDEMLAACAIVRADSLAAPRWHAHAAFMRSAFSRIRSSWLAQVVRFPIMRLPCLQVLGLRAPQSLSTFGRQLAAAIASDEHAVLQAASA